VLVSNTWILQPYQQSFKAKVLACAPAVPIEEKKAKDAKPDKNAAKDKGKDKKDKAEAPKAEAAAATKDAFFDVSLNDTV